MRKKIAVILGMVMCLAGCKDSDVTIQKESVIQNTLESNNQEAEDTLQFIEIYAADGDLVGIMEDNSSINDFTEKEDVSSWEFINVLPEDAEVLYRYNCYAVVSEEIYLNGSAPFIAWSSDTLYKVDNNYYIQNSSLNDEGFTVKIPSDTGIYLSQPEQLPIEKNKKKEDIISEWKQEISNLLDAPKSVQTEEIETEVNDSEKITKKDVEQTSSQQKIEIYDSKNENVLYKTENLQDIADYLNATSIDNWKDVDDIPDSAKLECRINGYALDRKSIKKKLVHMYVRELYIDGIDNYCKLIIPSNGESKEYISYYKISNEVVTYIQSLYLK